jgi:hypothetical protein
MFSRYFNFNNLLGLEGLSGPEININTFFFLFKSIISLGLLFKDKVFLPKFSHKRNHVISLFILYLVFLLAGLSSFLHQALNFN